MELVRVAGLLRLVDVDQQPSFDSSGEVTGSIKGLLGARELAAALLSAADVNDGVPSRAVGD